MTGLRHFFASLAAAVLAFAVFGAPMATATIVTVLGTDDLFLAGLTAGEIPSTIASGAGTLPRFVSVTPGEIINITASGTIAWGHDTNGNPYTTGPNGGGADVTIDSVAGSYVGTYQGSQWALAGVFLGPGVTTSAPASPFFVGVSDLGVVAPIGATELFLGIVDYPGTSPGQVCCYADNGQELTVSLWAPAQAPGSGLIALASIFVLFARAHRREG